MWDAHDGMGWWMIFSMIWVVLFWGLIIGLIVWAISRFSGSGAATTSPPSQVTQKQESALDIAKRRYASGEITREEFEQLRRDLS
jgi:putative membrane protein